ncbi:predicted protein [Uncinocarpus reesii 1704]|uniref:Uncharacterized protein n=1 Tax=Uncinocarpus reesii (strain UAMH 1704) TaxID=336963 RepID=C4JS94_UNCRE|nr:uncharacterized protein UREG_05333 [Uncinocarpus reesii 1704]EEP80491.1 predicted protein [Uncinocarpus reesii 1704]
MGTLTFPHHPPRSALRHNHSLTTQHLLPDQDGDSEMLSSSSSSPSSFTSDNGQRPQTPTAAHPFISASTTTTTTTAHPAAGLSSPPASQSKPQSSALDLTSAEHRLPTPAGGSGSAAPGEPETSTSTAQVSSTANTTAAEATTASPSNPAQTEEELILHGPPGASWNNRQAQEEYRRAMEYVIDKDFNLDAFGDPFDERDMEMPS